MAKKIIRITEEDLRGIIREAVSKALRYKKPKEDANWDILLGRPSRPTYIGMEEYPNVKIIGFDKFGRPITNQPLFDKKAQA